MHQGAEVGHVNQFQDDRNRWLVQSESDKNRYLVVTIDKDFECCTCPDSQIRGNICKHITSSMRKDIIRGDKVLGALPVNGLSRLNCSLIIVEIIHNSRAATSIYAQYNLSII